MRFELDRSLQEWQELCDRAISYAKSRGAAYADIRISLVESEGIAVEGFGPDPAKISSTGKDISEGLGVRVLVDGTWGFSAGSLFGQANAEDHVRRAVEAARANASLQRRPVVLAPIDTSSKPIFFATPYQTDPFEVPWSDKLLLLLRVDQVMREASEKIFKRDGSISLRKKKKILATTDGVFAHQEFMESGAAIQAHARRFVGDDAQRRSYPDSYVHYVAGGWEVIEKMELVKNAGVIAEEAERLLTAPYAPEGERDVILLSTMANLHCGHETIHGFEADRVLGTEWTLAGGSFITAILPEIGNYRFGSEHVTILADSTEPQGVATFACDDEGVPAQRNYLVKEGVIVGLLTSREAAVELNHLLGREYFKGSGGTVRAMNALNWPLIRMVNIIIQPGELPFAEMQDRVPQGAIMFGTNKSWSIDDIRRHFNFGTEIAWEKVSDNRWELRKNAKYSGDNLTFFRSCRGFASPESFFMHGIGNCGKDVAPIQSIPTGHGSSPGWFSKVKVSSVGHMEGR